VNGKLERILKEANITLLRYYSGIYLVGLMKTMKSLNEDIQYPG
jgi:hypothetical protein